MTIGKMVLETRKTRGFTQQQYGDKFGVTRQTVSSWENEKSYPDLQTLISICDEFNMSLDMLLRDDKTMVRKIDHGAVIIRLFKVGIRICGLLAALFTIYMAIWYNYKIQAEKQFINIMTYEGFELKDGVYVLKENNTTYTIPNQKIPSFKFHFFNTIIKIHYSLDDDLSMLISSPDFIIVNANNDNDISFQLDNTGTVKHKEKLNAEENQIYVQYGDEIRKMVNKGVMFYDSVYNNLN